MADTSTLRLRIFDGSRQLFSKPADFLVKIVDGNQTQQVWRDYTQNDITFNGLPFYNNLFDNYTVVVSSDGYKQAGYQPVKLSNSYTTTLDIMLIADDPGFSFVNARWNTANARPANTAANATIPRRGSRSSSGSFRRTERLCMASRNPRRNRIPQCIGRPRRLVRIGT